MSGPELFPTTIGGRTIGVARSAWLDGEHRYDLQRRWRWSADGPGLLTFVMLNPSTADASTDDTTTRRCMAFAMREGFDGVRLVNLFAYRATNPAELAALTPSKRTGAENDVAVITALGAAKSAGAPVVAAWGANIAKFPRRIDVETMADVLAIPLLCLGHTGGGHPKHPARLAANTPLVPFK